jgi:alkylhydroperoxidase family enzyme
MSWVPWIETENENTSNVEAKNLYARTRHPITRKISDLTRLTSLTPQTSELINQLCTLVYQNATGLSVREKEIAALVTSSLNGCVH